MNNPLNCTCKLAGLMRGLVDEPGSDFERLVLVELKPGERVTKHQHTQHTVLYYPADAAPVLVTPVAGMIIYLPPGTPHQVPASDDPRVSVAMLVEPAA